jgi:transcriptional regulator NrdR family protein
MNCPKCNTASTVVDTRKVNGARQRKRRCKKGHEFFTGETVIIKWDYIDPRIKEPGTGKGRAKSRAKVRRLQKTRVGKLILKKNSPAWVKSIYMKINQ